MELVVHYHIIDKEVLVLDHQNLETFPLVMRVDLATGYWIVFAIRTGRGGPLSDARYL